MCHVALPHSVSRDRGTHTEILVTRYTESTKVFDDTTDENVNDLW